MANPYVAPFDVNFAHQEGYTTYGFFAPMSGSPGANGKPFHPEEVVVTGFPSDVKSRELRNLLRHLPGFQNCELIRVDEKVQGKALFQSQYHAKNALLCLRGYEFDDGVRLDGSLTSGAEVCAEDRASGEQHGNGMEAMDGGSNLVTMPMESAGMQQGGPQQFGGAQHGGMMPFPTAAGPFPYPTAAVMAPHVFAPVKNEKDNPPCNTLFIGNLSDNVDEEELREVFGKESGFQQLKVVKSSKGISAFIEFADTESAMACHQAQQGLVLKSSDRGAIRVQFSKNPFGRKRETNATTAAIPVAAAPVPAIPAGYGAFAMQVPPQMVTRQVYGGPVYG